MHSTGDATVGMLIPISAAAGIGFALLQWFIVSKVELSRAGNVALASALAGGEVGEGDREKGVRGSDVVAKCAEIQKAVAAGSKSFLFTEYKYVGIFMVICATAIFFLLGSANGFGADSKPCAHGKGSLCKPALTNAVFSTVAFLLGVLTSLLCGLLGMMVSTFSNSRIALEAGKSVGKAFVVAFRSAAAISFLNAATGLLALYTCLKAFQLYFGDDWEGLCESLMGYSLGASSMALFGRVGGGIYMRTTDVGSDFIRKMERSIPERDLGKPAVIADVVGDITGDIIGMGSDVFGSYAGSSCTALYVASISSFGICHDFSAMAFPLFISSIGIVVCLVTSLFACHFSEIDSISMIQPSLKHQIVISAILMTLGIAIISFAVLPADFNLFTFGNQKSVKSWHLFLCAAIGLWAGVVIRYSTEYYTSNAHRPVQNVADSCAMGSGANIISGLALGYKSVIFPTFTIAAVIYISFGLASFYGISIASLGMLSIIGTTLTIYTYCPISDNAHGIAKMVGMGHRLSKRADALNGFGNSMAAVSKGFAIGSAALVSVALFGTFLIRAGLTEISLLDARILFGLITGAMLPYWFSAMTMKSANRASLSLVEEIHRQVDIIPDVMNGRSKPGHSKRVKIALGASLKEMILPGALVMLSPLLAGTFLGVETLAGLLAGSVVSGVQVALSSSNSGGAWDNAKKYIEAGFTRHARSLGPKQSDPHKASAIGDTTGDLLRDTSGPSLNILMKLMAVESLVLAPFFSSHGGLILKLL